MIMNEIINNFLTNISNVSIWYIIFLTIMSIAVLIIAVTFVTSWGKR